MSASYPSASAAYPSGAAALAALVDAKTQLQAIARLRGQVGTMIENLDSARTQLEWDARQALEAIDQLAASDPAQLRAVPSEECLKKILRATEKTTELGHQVVELLAARDQRA